MAINLSPRDFNEIFREQEENENELARIELDQARQELQREKMSLLGRGTTLQGGA